jgi:sporulation protein YlmC with PRC-barrel domain
MKEYKFDGKELRRRGSKVATVDGRDVRDAGGKRVGQIDGKYIRDSNGKKIGEFDGQTIRDCNGVRTGTIRDVEKEVDGLSGIAMVALWMLIIRE